MRFGPIGSEIESILKTQPLDESQLQDALTVNHNLNTDATLLSPQSLNGLDSVNSKQNSHHVFDRLCMRRNKLNQQKKLSLSPKTWMFKFKNRPHTRSWVQEKLWFKESMAANVDNEDSAQVCRLSDVTLGQSLYQMFSTMPLRRKHMLHNKTKEISKSWRLKFQNDVETSVNRPKQMVKSIQHHHVVYKAGIKNMEVDGRSRASEQASRFQKMLRWDSRNMPQLINVDMQPMNKVVEGVHKLVAIDEAATMLDIKLSGLRVVCVFGLWGRRTCDQFCMPALIKFHNRTCIREQLAFYSTHFIRWYSTLVDKNVYFSVWHCWKNKAETSLSVSGPLWLVLMAKVFFTDRNKLKITREIFLWLKKPKFLKAWHFKYKIKSSGRETTITMQHTFSNSSVVTFWWRVEENGRELQVFIIIDMMEIFENAYNMDTYALSYVSLTSDKLYGKENSIVDDVTRKTECKLKYKQRTVGRDQQSLKFLSSQLEVTTNFQWWLAMVRVSS